MLNALGNLAIAAEDGEIIRNSSPHGDGGFTNEYLIKDGKCEIGTDVNHFKREINQTITLYQLNCEDDYDKIFATWGILVKDISQSEEMRDYYFIVDKQLDFEEKYFKAEIVKILTERFLEKDFLKKYKDHIVGGRNSIGLDTQYFLTHSNILSNLFETVKSAGWNIGTIEVQDDDYYVDLKNDETKGMKLPTGKNKVMIPSAARIMFRGGGVLNFV